MKFVALAVVALATALSTGFSARAADITQTFDATDSGYTDQLNSSISAPFSSAALDFTITYDPNALVGPTSVGLTINSSTLPTSYTSGLEYFYDPTTQLLTVGSKNVEDGAVVNYANQNGVALFIYSPTSVSTLDATNYNWLTLSNNAISFIPTTSLLTIKDGGVSAAPEPSTWLLLMLGIGGAGLAMRWGRSKDMPLADMPA